MSHHDLFVPCLRYLLRALQAVIHSYCLQSLLQLLYISYMPSFKPQHRGRQHHTSHPPPLFWDKLAKLWLTKSALEEASRRNKPLSSDQGFFSIPHTFAPDFLRGCSATRLQEIRKLSRCGGPDLSDIRNVSYLPVTLFQHRFLNRFILTGLCF